MVLLVGLSLWVLFMPSNSLSSTASEFKTPSGDHFQLKQFQQETLGYLQDKQSCLLVAPTGSGKSMCYQSYAAANGFVVVVLPLISLIRDQNKKCLDMGLKCRTYHHQISYEEKQNISLELDSKRLDILFVTPEGCK